MSSELSSRAVEVIREIQEGFEGTSYPGDDRLVEGCSGEAAEIANFLKRRKWQDLHIDELLWNRQSLLFMTPEAIRYYLPAYLMLSVRDYEGARTIPETLLFLFRPPASDDADGWNRFNARFDSLSQGQRDAIKAFLEYVRDEHAEDFVQAHEASDLLRWWMRA